MKADSSYVMDSTEEAATKNQDESQDENQNDKPGQVQLLLWDDIDDS